MRLTTREEFASTPERVFAVIRDEGFQRAKCEATSTGEYDAEVVDQGERTIVRSHRRLPSDGLPDIARSFVGEVLTVVEVQDWGPAAADGSRRCRVDLHIIGAPLTLHGEAELAPGGPGTVETLEAELKASVPLIGGKIEKAAVEPIINAITIEAETIRSFLA